MKWRMDLLIYRIFLYGVRIGITVRRIDPPFIDNEEEEDVVGDEDGSEDVVDGGGTTRHGRNQDRQRYLQNKQVTITYDQSITYRIIPGKEADIEDIVSTPFNNISRRRIYLELLRNGGNDAFAALVEVKEPKLPSIDEDTDDDGGGGDKDVSTGGAVLAIIIGVGSTVVFILIIGGAYWWWNQKKKKQQYDSSQPSRDPSYPNNVQVGVTARDEVSTLVDPESRNGIINNAASLAGYGTQSIGTVDYDYVKVYGGGTGDKSVSTAGGTIGDATRQTRFSNADSSQYTGTMMMNGPGGASMYMEEPSFQEHLRRSEAPQIREEIVDVLAPPGRLGIVIDTPNDGAPVIHNLKDTCSIADQL